MYYLEIKSSNESLFLNFPNWKSVASEFNARVDSLMKSGDWGELQFVSRHRDNWSAVFQKGAIFVEKYGADDSY